MGNYEELKQAVSNVIKTNGNQEITGAILQNSLLTIISTVGRNATFAGIANPETNPGTPDENVFYIASENGTYVNFNKISVKDEVCIIQNDNGTWTKKNTGIINKEISQLGRYIGKESNLNGILITEGKYVRFQNNEFTERKLDSAGYTDFIDLHQYDLIALPFIYAYGGVWFNEDKSPISEILMPEEEDAEYRIIERPTNAYYLKLNVPLSMKDNYIYLVGDYGLLKYLGDINKNINNSLLIQPKRTNNLYDNNTIVNNQFIWVDSNYVATERSSTQHFRSDYIDIEGIKLLYISKVTDGVSIIWYNVNKELIGFDEIPNPGKDYIFVAPTNTKYCIINEDKEYANVYEDILVCDAKLMLLSTTYKNYLDINLIDKKIAWYGTSIPHGYPYQNTPLQNIFAYPNRVAAQLGAKIQNRCVSGGFIISKGNTEYTGSQSLRFTDLTSTINYQNSIVDLIGTADEPDIFVFDWGANDGQFYQNYFDTLDLDTLDYESEDINTFFGAYNFIIKQTLNAKPNARIIICTHYSDDGQSGEMTKTNGYKKMNDLIIKIAEYWHLPVNDVRSKTGWIYNRNGVTNLKPIYCNDGIHPAASYNIKSINILTEIHLQFIKSIFG